MTLDGFLTFFGILFAAYAVIDPVTRLRIRLDSPAQLTLLFVSIAAVIFFQFVNPIVSVLPLPLATWFVGLRFGQPEDVLNNTQMAFIVTLVWSVSAVTLYSFNRPRARRIRRLPPLVERLYDSRRYIEILTLVSPYIDVLKRSFYREHLLEKLHDRLEKAGRGTFRTIDLINMDKNRKQARYLRFSSLVSSMIPSARKRTTAAREIVDLIAKSRDIRHVLQTQKPEFAAIFFKTFQSELYDEFDRYVLESMMNSESHLRSDLRKTTNLARETYALDPSAIVLNNFLEDISFAQRSGIWRPVGEAAIKVIEEDEQYADVIRRPPPVEDEDLFNDITYSAIHFFDVMVTRAAVSGLCDNMWLMYLMHFVRKIITLSSLPLPQSSRLSEFPTLGLRLIWECQYRLSNWVELSWRLPEGNPNSSPSSFAEAREICAIPYWAAWTLCIVVRNIITSDDIPEEFKRERFGSFVRTCSKLPKSGPGSYLREYMAEAIVLGPPDAHDRDLSDSVRDMLSHVDVVDRFNFSELNVRLQ
ncbi:hypothetical protein [Paracoccus niistensis]|uniref:Uncharacterized protein n=1 Tax=Paracoccus niistensis TaxID=632935 RepID=A0ABV6I375_9RHOB